MPTIPPRFIAQRGFGKAALAADVLASVSLVIYGIIELATREHAWGVAPLAVGLITLALGILVYAHMSLTHKAVNNSYRSYDTLLDISEMLRRQSDYIRRIADNSSLSEWAKRIVYREKDYEYLRDTIQGAMVRQDWVIAERLIQDMDDEFGLHEEAATLRHELAKARQATAEEKIATALKRFEALCSAQKWDQAHQDSTRLLALFPEDPRIAELPRVLEQRRQQFKRKLLREYDDAVRTQNVDVAHRLLFELDHYLAPNEAAALKESARGVFKAKLLQMGVEFSLAVSDHRFNRAIDVGERLMREFPNSRYAQEIQSMLPALRQRAVQEISAHDD
ncbi:MAG: hypothetical protein ABIG44_14095 [Planctomycetota bacterium]